MMTHSSDFDQLAAIGAVRYLRADRPSAPPIAGGLGLARQALWSLHPQLELACPDPDGRLLRVAFAGAVLSPPRDWVRSIVQIPLVALHASRPIRSVLIGLERA